MSNSYVKWNQLGLIPGPQETEEDFVKRAHFCLQLKRELITRGGDNLPFKEEDLASEEIIAEAGKKASYLYGISPSWIPLFFSNGQLAPWHGGCAWIFQLDQDTPTAAILQLRAKFRSKNRYLGIYKRDELIVHELAHVGRMLYEEPQFEELLAYRSSSSSWRAWLGPIVESAKESLIFVLLLAVVIIANMLFWASSSTQSTYLLLILEIMPVGLVLFALVRLTKRHKEFDRCLHKLATIYQNEETANHLIYRLTDKEIRSFASWPIEKIVTFMKNEKNRSFRWRFLNDVYPI